MAAFRTQIASGSGGAMNVLALLVACLLSGCGMPKTIVWSPDGSEIVFPTDDGGLAAYDIANRQKRSIPIDLKTANQTPAISGNGEYIAIADVRSTADEDQIQLIAYSRAGDRVRQSSVHRWPGRNGELELTQQRQSGVLWSKSGRHMLVWFQSGLNPTLHFGRYDWESDTLVRIDETPPAIDMLQVGMNPIRDDDFGYLALRRTHDGEQTVFLVSWDGWEHELEMQPELRLFDAPVNTDPDFELPPQFQFQFQNGGFRPRLEMSQRLPLTSGRWLGGVIKASLGRGAVSVDTVNRRAMYQLDRDMLQKQQMFGEQRVFFRVPIGDGPYAVQCRVSASGQSPEFLLELSNDVEARTMPIGRAAFNGQAFSPVVPAPDGSAVAVIHADETGRIFTTVIDDTGKSVANFQISGAGWNEDITADRPSNVTSLPRRTF